MTLDMRLVAKGKDEPLAAVIQQGRYHAGLGGTCETDLADWGWSKEQTQALAEDVSQLDTEAAEKADARGMALSATAGQEAAVDEAKDVIDKVRNAAPIVLRKHPTEGVTEDSFEAGHKLTRSVPRISGYLSKLVPVLEKVDEHFKPYNKGQSVLAQVKAAKTRLDAADTSQELLHAALPAETLGVYERKGRVLQAIEEMNRVAKNAYRGQAEMIARFNKDILLRGRKKRKDANRGSAPADQ